MLIQRGNIPQVDTGKVPPEEHDQIWLLNNALGDVQNYVDTFQQAVHLFEYCMMQASVLQGSPTVFGNWQMLAARDAVMSVWHFKNTLDTANAIANKSLTVSPHLNRDSLGQAFDMFKAAFPDFDGIRHAVAHAGEMGRSKQVYDKHSFSGDYQGEGVSIKESRGIMLQNNLMGRKYTCTHEGKIVSCEISGVSLSHLLQIGRAFYLGFVPKQPEAVAP